MSARFDRNVPANEGFNKGQAADLLNQAFVKHSVSEKGVNDILSIVKILSPALQLPLRENVRNKTHILPNTIQSYLPRDDRSMEIDVCRAGCTAFHGKDADKIYCPDLTCNAQRYLSNCKHCLHKPYPLCNPFKAPVGKRTQHTAKSRFSAATGFYRPVIPKLIKMYIRSLTDVKQRDLLRYHDVRVRKEGE